jgi:hypothetical protein
MLVSRRLENGLTRSQYAQLLYYRICLVPNSIQFNGQDVSIRIEIEERQKVSGTSA